MGELREELEAAMAGEDLGETEIVEEVSEEVVETRARDDQGRFAKTEEPAADVEKEVQIEAKETSADEEIEPKEPVALAPPNGWSAEAKANWHELPEHIQAAVNQREIEAHKRISQHDDDRNFGKEISRVVQPYLAQITADGGTPASAVQNMMNTAYVLRTGSQEQKFQSLMGIAQEFGIDLSNQQAPAGDSSEYSALQNRINSLEGHLTARETNEQNQLKFEIQQEVDAFASDPEYPHYGEVKAHMAALLQNGTAKDLKGAYEQACWASPEVRTTLLAQQRVEEDQKRKADAKAKVEAAKKAGIGITGGPGNSNSKPAPESRSLREELEANFAASDGAV